VVDTRTFATTVVKSTPLITEQTFTTSTTIARADGTRGSGGFPWEVVLAAAVLAVIGGAVRLRTGLRHR
jgi:hypothetical protein